MKVIETWHDDVDNSYYFTLKVKENEFLDVKLLEDDEDDYAYVLYDAVYAHRDNGEDNLFRNCTQEENNLALDIVDEYYAKYIKDIKGENK